MSDMTISKGGDNLVAVTDESPGEPLFYKSKPKEGKSRLIKTVSLTDRVLQSLLSYVGHDDGAQKAIDSWYKEHAERCRLMDERAKLEFFYRKEKEADPEFENSVEAKTIKLSIENITLKLRQESIPPVSFLGSWADSKPKLTPYSAEYLPPEFSKIYEQAYLKPQYDWCSTMSSGLKNNDIKITKMEFKNIPLYAAGSTKSVCYGFAI